jgi:allophanate hydrolase
MIVRTQELFTAMSRVCLPRQTRLRPSHVPGGAATSSAGNALRARRVKREPRIPPWRRQGSDRLEHDINDDHPERAGGSASRPGPALAGSDGLATAAGARALGPVLTLAGLARAYSAGASPASVLRAVLARIADRGDDHAWISLRGEAELAAEADAVAERWPDPARRPPLFGVPYAVKDNIDVAGLPTTAACPAFAYQPDADAPLVARLRAAGAVCVGKTNLDQFATGLSGARSPYGTCESPLLPGLISGGSSSGSAVAVAAGLVPFSIGTDTAGSGRVPAALCGIVGLKPSLGLVSTLGTVPACASLDCPSVFANSVADAAAVLAVIAAFEPSDPWSRPLPGPGPLPRQAQAGDSKGRERPAATPPDEEPGSSPAQDAPPELATRPGHGTVNGAALPEFAVRPGTATPVDVPARAGVVAPTDARADTAPPLPRFGVPHDPEFYGDAAAAAAFAEVIELIGGAADARYAPANGTAQPVGQQPLAMDISDFLAAGRLLYQGPWVAERLAGVGDFVTAHPDQVHPVTRAVLDSGRGYSAADAFRGLHQLAELRAKTRATWELVDVLIVPTVPTTFTVEEMLADPVRRNSMLGHYTTFGNLLDLCAVAIPAGFTAAGRPHGITLLAPAGSDALLARTAARLEPLLDAQSPR